MSVGTQEDQKRALDPLGLQLQVVGAAQCPVRHLSSPNSQVFKSLGAITEIFMDKIILFLLND